MKRWPDLGPILKGLDPLSLRPAHGTGLLRSRLEFQRSIALSGERRWSNVFITHDRVIIDGHHATRAHAELGRLLDVEVRKLGPGSELPGFPITILDLPVIED